MSKTEKDHARSISVTADESDNFGMDDGIFGAKFDFVLDDYDVMGRGNVSAESASAEKPPSHIIAASGTEPHGAPSKKSSFKLPNRDQPVAIGDEGDQNFVNEYWRLDPRIKKLESQMIPSTPVNLEWAFWHEPTCRAMGTTIYATIIGDGVQIITMNPAVKSTLDKYNDDNAIADVIRDLVFDNIIHGDSLFIKKVVKFNNEERLKVFRIDMRTIRRIQHDFEGWLKWKQYAYVRGNMPESKKKFDDEDYDPLPMVDPNYELVRSDKGTIHTTQILESEVLHFNLFRESPMMAVLDLCVHKKWIINFMRKSAYRFSTPIPIIKIGTELHHPTSVDNYKKILKRASDRASEWRNFDAWAIPFNWDIKMEQPRDTGAIMVGMLEWLSKEIMLALSGSISLFQNMGNALSTGGQTIMQNFLRIVKGMQTKIGSVLKTLYREVLILSGIDEQLLDTPEFEFRVGWSEMSDQNMKDYVALVLQMLQSGLLKNKIEARDLIRRQMPGLKDIREESELNGDNSAGAQIPAEQQQVQQGGQPVQEGAPQQGAPQQGGAPAPDIDRLIPTDEMLAPLLAKYRQQGGKK